ncbi:MAG: hypothetical protein ABSA53_37110 [Streptosporangiaceae bacterium]
MNATDQIDGSVLLTGHSYAGVVITNAATSASGRNSPASTCTGSATDR